jgi:antitoxin YqcF
MTMSGTGAPISPENKTIARYVAAAFGGTPRVGEYLNASGTLSVGILSSVDRPAVDLTSYSTIKLSDHPMAWGDGEFPTRLELAGLCETRATFFPRVLVSAAFTIMQSDAVYHPGTVMRDLVRESDASTTLPHLFLTGPFAWDTLKTLDCGTKTVSWLLAMPISESEYAYLRQHGEKALERLFEQHRIDVANPERPAVV